MRGSIARKIINLLNTYFDLMVEVLSKHGAIIDKFIGDAIVARFDSGDPATDALNAVRGAWGMCRDLERFNLDSFEEVQSQLASIAGRSFLETWAARHRHGIRNDRRQREYWAAAQQRPQAG